MILIPIYIIGTAYVISFVLANNDTKQFNIKDKIDWSKWTTVDGYKITTQNKLLTSTVATYQNKPIALDWSRWEEKSESSSSSRPSTNQDVQNLLDWLKRTTTEAASIRGKVKKKQEELPRKPKVTEQNFIEESDVTLEVPKGIFDDAKNAETGDKEEKKIVSTALGDLESLEDILEFTATKKPIIDPGYLINNAKVIGGINWSLWNENGQTKLPNRQPISASESDKDNPTQIEQPILPNSQSINLIPSQTDQTPLESLKEREEEDVPSFFGWPWWAWLICALMTAILLGMVYITVFWNDFKDCLHGREIFCALSRNEK